MAATTHIQAPSDTADRLLVRGPDQGEALWMLNSLLTVKASARETGGAYSLLEQVVTAAGNPPLHLHTDEDEAFYVLAGEIEVQIGDRVVAAPAGTFAFAPRGVPHTYRVVGDEARLLVIGSPGGIDAFFAEVGQPAPSRRLPEPVPPDVAHVVAVAARHDIVILPPA